jgi:hypothetical protein
MTSAKTVAVKLESKHLELIERLKDATGIRSTSDVIRVSLHEMGLAKGVWPPQQQTTGTDG